MSETGVNWFPHLLNAAHGNVGGAVAGVARDAASYLSSPTARQMESLGNLLYTPDPEAVGTIIQKASPSTLENLLTKTGASAKKGATVGVSEDINSRKGQ